ncbi:hypothetical protein HXX76_011205 [Chlamydomonas incerta]|uniref:Glycosyltransferase family 92 protein n=1 Tax=Chlamydomonas incerta TaxID=51695 RepID=A0A835SZW6_CHLIN|nr:hypothetical protein HXX76_011205 [Chlamydomonas incerta]|eukprot:KAG2428961.1 hypothetical protein HXX76_011205 [Chlamydomonas incerta]
MRHRLFATFVGATLTLAVVVAGGRDDLVLSSGDVGVHKCEFQGITGDGRSVRLYVFLTACTRPPAATDDTGAQRRQQGSGSGWQNSSANLYVTGNTFMLVEGEPCTTTQLQQPLDALVWAAGLWNGGGSSSSSSSTSNRRKGLEEAPRVTNVATAQGRGLAAARRRKDQDASDGTGAAAAHEPEAALLAEATRALVAGSEGVLTLRSRLTGTDHRLRLAVHEPYKWRNNPSLRREPGRVTGALTLTPPELQAVARGSADVGDGSSSGSGSGGKDAPALFEVRAAGLDGVCAYTPRRGRRPPPPAPAAPIDLASRVDVGGTAATAGGSREHGGPGAAGVGAPACAWLDPERQAYDAATLDSWREAQRVSAALAAAKKHRAKDRGAAAEARASPPPPPPPLAGTGARPPSYVVVSPYFGLAPGDFVTLLTRHVEYHAQLGVGRHLVYVEEGEEGLAADARVAALVAAGRLELVRWRELPVFNLPAAAATAPAEEGAGARAGASEDGGAVEGARRHPYASQILTYNHALLALWHEAAVVAVLDLDEFVVTSAPQPLEAALRACSPRGRYPPGALWVPRRSLLCTDCWGQAAGAAQALGAGAGAGGDGSVAAMTGLAGAQLRNATLAAEAATLERRLWLQAGGQAAVGVAGGSQAHHPLESYRHWFLGWHHKSVMYSHLVTYFGVHLAYIEEGAAGQGQGQVPNEGGLHPHTICRLGCMWVAHLETQLGPRVRSPLEALAQHNSKGEAEKRTAGGGGAGGKKQKVTAVEGRYWWALQRWLGRPAAGRGL